MPSARVAQNEERICQDIPAHHCEITLSSGGLMEDKPHHTSDSPRNRYPRTLLEAKGIQLAT